jgi:uncharacterized membrane protein
LESVLGLPLHPLVVHAVVVLVPLVATGMVVAVVSPVWAERLRMVLAALSMVAAAAAVAARSSGQALLSRVPSSPEVARHVELSDSLALFLIGAAGLVVGWAWAGSRGRPTRALGLAAAAGALVAAGWTVLAGHSGAESVWGDVL